jgi:hypothetical protein
VKKVREVLEDKGFFVEIAGRRTRPDMLAWQLRLCADIGADVLRTTVVLEDTIQQTIQNAKRDLEAILPLAHDLGVRIALENHEDLRAGELLSIIEGINDDLLGVCLDTGNGQLVYEEPETTASLLAPYAITTHIKDQRLIRMDGTVFSVGVKLGSGDIDLPGILPIILKKSGLHRLLIQDTIGYSAPLNPKNRDDLRDREISADIPDMTREDLKKEGLLFSIKGSGDEELTSWASIKSETIKEDVEFLRSMFTG